MPSFTELLATHGRMMELTVLGAVCIAGVLMLAWGKVRGRVMMGTVVALCMVMLPTSAAQPEKPAPKKTPVSDDVFVKPASRNLDKDKTPLGRYYRQVTQAVEKKWRIYIHLRQHEGLTQGVVQLVFYVNKKGKVESLKVLNDEDFNPLLTQITLQAIKDAEIPPMPADVTPLLPKNDRERLKIEYNALIY